MSILRNKIGAEFFAKIDKGLIRELDVQGLHQFVSMYPKETEVDHLKARMAKLGISTFSETMDSVPCGQVERFMLTVLSHESDLKHRAEILIQIMEMGPRINKLLQQI